MSETRANTKTSLTKLNQFWAMEDDEIIDELEKFNAAFANNEFDPEQYQSTLAVLFSLNSLGFEGVQLDACIEQMKECIRTTGKAPYSWHEPWIDKEAMGSDYNDYEKTIAELRGCKQEGEANSWADKLNRLFADGKFEGSKLNELYHEGEQHFLTSGQGFLALLDIKGCIGRLRESSTKDFSDFRRSLATVYEFANIKDYFQPDLDNLNELKNYLESTTYQSRTKEYNRKCFIKQIDEVIVKLEQGSAVRSREPVDEK